jgi:protein tyrosine/serine phosphatase
MMRTITLLSRTLLLFAAACCASAAPVRAQATAAGATVPPATAVVAPTEKLSLSGLPNSGRVNDFLFRGAQPRPAGYDDLKHLGITLVVDLHNRSGGSERERHEVESRGMRYVSIPTDFLDGPTLAQIAEFLFLVRGNPGQKIFVHCRYGSDRTSVMIASFRMTQDHWTLERARAEMFAYHFHQFWLPAMNRTVRDFPKNYESDPAFSKLRLVADQGK